MLRNLQINLIKSLAPKGSRRRKITRKVIRVLGFLPPHFSYSDWIAEQKDKIELFEVVELKHQPLVSIVVPAFNTPKEYLYPLIYSVVGQAYTRWELIIVNASSDQKSKKIIQDCINIDARIKTFETDNKGISANTNFGLDKSRGEYIGFMDHDDTLNPNALLEVVKAINEHPETGVFYSDEDKLSEDGMKYLRPHLKPDWSPDLLTHLNYITHFLVAKKEMIEKAGRLDPKKDGAQDYDLVLKLTDLNSGIVHIPKVLYHWREAKNSTATAIENKPYIKKAGEEALRDHYKRIGISAKVKALEGKPGFYKTSFTYNQKPSVIVPIFANRVLISRYLAALNKLNLLIQFNLITHSQFRNSIQSEAIFINEENNLNFLQNAIEKAGDRLIIINDFIFSTKENWAKELVGILNLPHVHSAAPIIVRPDKTIEDCGLVNNGYGGISLFKGYKFGSNTYFGDTDWTRNVDAISGKVIAARKSELLDFLKKKKNSSARELAYEFSSKKTKDKYNVMTSNPTLVHVRFSQQFSNSKFMNPGMQQNGSDLQLYPDDQQIQDALIAFEKYRGKI